jgi:hypothetical protein
MPAKRTEHQRAADMALTEHWHLRGKTLREIREMLMAQRPYSLSMVQLHKDLQHLKRAWEKEAMATRTEAVANELKGLKAQEDELWIAWEKSKRDAVRTTIDLTPTGKPKKKGKNQKQTEPQHGDPRYHDLIMKVREQRRKLLGLDMPLKLEHTGDDGSPLEFVVRLTEEELPK